MKKPVILVDLDGVLVDLLPAWLSEYGERTDEWIHPDDIMEYQFEQFVQDKEEFWSSLQPALQYAMPTRGATAFRDLYQSSRYEVYVVTYAHHSAPNAHRAKLDWLARFFPDFERDRVIFTKHKELVRGDLLIEDSPQNCERWLATNPKGLAVIVAQPYNQGHNPGCRVETFAEIPTLLRWAFPKEET